MEDLLDRLEAFLRKAQAAELKATPVADPHWPGFFRFEWSEGDFRYLDQATGIRRSTHQIIIWYKDRPFWYMSYGGGMEAGFRDSDALAMRVRDLHVRALSAQRTPDAFRPRGPQNLSDGLNYYTCEWKGSVKAFRGDEKLFLGLTLACSYQFFGGLLDADGE